MRNGEKPKRKSNNIVMNIYLKDSFFLKMIIICSNPKTAVGKIQRIPKLLVEEKDDTIHSIKKPR